MSLDVYLRSPSVCPHCKAPIGESVPLYIANIAHDLCRMADAAGIYRTIWRPDEIGITTAAQLIKPLRGGLALLKANPARFEVLNPPNGWGSYELFVPWVEKYIAACEADPAATVEVSR